MNSTSIKLALQDPRDYMLTYGINSLFTSSRTEFKSNFDLPKNRYISLNKVKLSDVKTLAKRTFIERNLNLFVYGFTSDVNKHISKLGTFINQVLK